jgi:UDP-galactopyranose mutase
VEAFIQGEAGKEGIKDPANLEEKAISLIGRPLYEAFVEGYTLKQWQTYPKLLPKEIIQRLPIRASYENGYFADTYEGLPVNGYYSLFNRMVENPLITVQLGTAWEEMKERLSEDTFVFYSGPIDAFFNYQFGRLEYRSLDFKLEVKPVADWQGCAVLNYADKDVPYTRVHEFKHLHPERREIFASPQTLICYEYSKAGKAGDELYYPVNTAPNQALFDQYAQLAGREKNLMIAGRLGSYRYFDMDKVIDNALTCFDRFHQTLVPTRS